MEYYGIDLRGEPKKKISSKECEINIVKGSKTYKSFNGLSSPKIGRLWSQTSSAIGFDEDNLEDNAHSKMMEKVAFLL